ncbi:MAG: hypothetical protein K8U03_09515 [Planctomycetia bacterium]|nr:hypothetical protein [Planctomycetia bacterium]
MISPEFLKMLRCPEDRSALHPADAATIALLGAAITAGTLRNRGGEVVTRSFDEGLIRADGKLLYPIVDQIPILLIDEGIPLN